MSRPSAAWSPPLRGGLQASRVAVNTPGPVAALPFLNARLPLVSNWAERLSHGRVLDSQGQPISPAQSLKPGQVLWYWREVPQEHAPPEDLSVVFQDEHLVVVDKPHFMSVSPAGQHVQHTALVRLRELLNLPELSPMHRLDLETAGLLVFVVKAQDRGAYQGLFLQGAIHKTYQAVVPHRPWQARPTVVRHRLVEPQGEGFMQMQVVEGPPNAELKVSLLDHCLDVPQPWQQWAADRGLDTRSGWSRLELRPSTGRKHQLRAQLNALGCPIAGDRIYPVLQAALHPQAPPDWSAPLQLLATQLRFLDPIQGTPRHFQTGRKLQAWPPRDTETAVKGPLPVPPAGDQ